MQNLILRAHLPAVRFSPRAYMGCGGWDLAQAPETAVASLESSRRAPVAPSRTFTRPVRMAGCEGIVYEPPIEDEEVTLSGPRVRMGCGDEPCEECKAKQAEAQMGCPKCKRIRQHAMMNQDEELRGRLSQIQILPDTSILVVSTLVVAGLFYLVTR